MKHLAYLLLFIPLSAEAGPLDVSARLADPSVKPVGAPITVVLEARHDAEGIALLPPELDLPDVLGERRSAREHQRERVDGAIVDRYRLQLLAFQPGLVELPALPLALGATVAQTSPLLIEVVSNLNEQELASVSSTAPQTLQILEQMAAQDPAPEAVLIPDSRPWIGLGIAVLVLGASVLLYRQLQAARRRPKVAPPPPPPRPAHELALSALATLERSDWLDRGEANRFYTELSHILRDYLGRRYAFDALERTVDELMEALARKTTPGLDRARLSTLLFEAEQVKFAKYVPPAEAGREALGAARAVVEATRVRPEPPRTEEAPA